MKKEIFIVEQGSVLPKTDDEYENYLLKFQEGNFPLYDEDYVVFLSLQEALDYASGWDEYNTYCLIHSSVENLTDEQIESIVEDGDYGTFINPCDDSVLYFAYKNNKKIVVVRDKTKELL